MGCRATELKRMGSDGWNGNGNGNGVPVLLIAMGRGIDAQNWLDSVKSRGPLLFLPGVAATAAVHRMDGILLACWWS
jgi:hypothetical protein